MVCPSRESGDLQGPFPDSVPNFTPRNANSKLMQAVNMVAPINEIAALKVKPVALPPGTPAHERTTENQKIKPAGERSVQEALDLLKDTYASAGERDIMTGDSVEFMVRLSGHIACCLHF